MMLNKIYQKNDKFGGIDDNLNFKLQIFYDKCKKINFSTYVYLQSAFFMLSDQALNLFYANQYQTFESFRNHMKQMFEGSEWQRHNLTKWHIIDLEKIIAESSTTSTTKCLRKLCLKLNILQKKIDEAYQKQTHLRENIIRACRDHSALIIKLFNAPMNVVDLINNLNTSIVNYEAVNKSSVQTYMQAHKKTIITMKFE